MSSQKLREALEEMVRCAQKQNWRDNYPSAMEKAHAALEATKSEPGEPVRKPELAGYFSFCEDKQKWLQQKSKGAEFNHLFTPLYAMRDKAEGGAA